MKLTSTLIDESRLEQHFMSLHFPDQLQHLIFSSVLADRNSCIWNLKS